MIWQQKSHKIERNKLAKKQANSRSLVGEKHLARDDNVKKEAKQLRRSEQQVPAFGRQASSAKGASLGMTN
jgi:hypothetical protein